MQSIDPIKRIDKAVRDAQDTAGYYTRPVLERYPFLFAFLLTLSTASVFTGFHFLVDRIPLLVENPAILIISGFVVLFLTGTLYETLKKGRE